MAAHSETPAVPAERVVRPDDERGVSDSEVEEGIGTGEPLDAPLEAPVEDVLEQRHVEPLDDDAYDMP